VSVPDEELAHRHAATHRAAYRLFASGSPGGTVVDLDGGVQAVMTPAVPERSLFNAVLYDESAPLLAALDELDRRYDAAGVRAWTVWTHPGDIPTAEALRAAGHAFDGEPMLMGASLGELDLEPRRALTLAETDDWEALARCNDAAYGLTDGTFGAALAGIADPAARAYVALDAGEPVAACGTVLRDGDAGVLFVATMPSAQRRGLASELMRHALREARAEGARTTSLEASAQGEPVYARMGYRSLGRLGMWERRKA
jgi:ribosomal protein S18 acetylase RimI-like enzyme